MLTIFGVYTTLILMNIKDEDLFLYIISLGRIPFDTTSAGYSLVFI